MCNLYSITTNQAAIAALFRVMNRYVGNLPPMPGVFPDYPAPVVRNVGTERELTIMRWGMSGGPIFDKEGAYVLGVVSKGWENEEVPENFSFGSMLRPSMGIPMQG